ncbi:hypothetical protein CIK77_02880 [Microbacterium sp. JB110]|nr:hypothetical protein CIK77_02880 [Microbacterium sp. JB110]SJM52892.1 Mobile element protein [Frigoribacterium sp. JB110]
MMFPLVQDLAAAGVPVAVTCRVLGFTKQAYYKWQARPCSPRDEDDAHLIDALRDAHHDDPAFGYRLLADELAADGHVASERRVWRLCSQEGIASEISKRGRGKGKRRPGPTVHDDRVQRVFTAAGPNEIWLTDITEHWTPWIPAVVATPIGEVTRWRRRDTPRSRRKSSSGYSIEAGLFARPREQSGWTRTPVTTGCARRG